MNYWDFFKDGLELSMRRLIAFWAMLLITICVLSSIFISPLDTQIIVILGTIASVGTGVSAIKNKYGDK